MINWTCPTGAHSAVRGPKRPRKNATCRYCLHCSLASSTLVERVAPSLEKARAAKEIREELKRQKTTAKLRADRIAYPWGWLATWWRRIGNLEAWGPYDLSDRKITGKFRSRATRVFRNERQVREGTTWTDATGKVWEAGERIPPGTPVPATEQSTGTAWFFQRRFAVTAGADRADALATLIHELAHLATPGDKAHGDKWRSVFFSAAWEVLGVEPKLEGAGRYDVHRAVREAVLESGAHLVDDPRTWNPKKKES